MNSPAALAPTRRQGFPPWDAISVGAQSGEPTCGTTGGGACTKVTATGTGTAGASTYKPSTSGFSVVAGTIKGCLTGPSGSDLDLYLQKLSGSTWTDVAAAETASSSETITYTAGAGTYRWDVYAYSGSGAYTLKVRHAIVCVRAPGKAPEPERRSENWNEGNREDRFPAFCVVGSLRMGMRWSQKSVGQGEPLAAWGQQGVQCRLLGAPSEVDV